MSELSERGRRRVYRVLVHVSLADGEVHPRERELLEAAREQLDLTEEEATVLAEEAVRGEGLQLDTASREGMLALNMVAGLVVADGVIHPDETRRLKKIAEALGVGADRLARIVKRSLFELNRGDVED